MCEMSMEQKRLLYNIQVLNFAVYDLTLYLDTHSYDKEALKYYNHYNALLKQSVEEYSMLYEPLTLRHVNKNDNCFKWALAPWPWEGVC
ncbi:spore coat protein CotJB [bacterium C-53]|nr:spore coat protein CotJB [Lachnospiraceae bacterium]NBI01755.1 spore coat protein CotJB [Lachnospiraceae bacterium]RKJ12175.1 spore coat protein CotJB [bacterium C-53]